MFRQITMERSRSYGIAYGEVPYRAATVAEAHRGANSDGSKPTAITTEPS